MTISPFAKAISWRCSIAHPLRTERWSRLELDRVLAGQTEGAAQATASLTRYLHPSAALHVRQVAAALDRFEAVDVVEIQECLAVHTPETGVGQCILEMLQAEIREKGTARRVQAHEWAVQF